MVEVLVDGRRLRRENNREAVIDALLALFREGVYQPNSAEIAERAGLSPRSLFRYFDDIDDLNRAAIERELAEAYPLIEIRIDSAAPLAERIAALVESRARLFDVIGPAARAARIATHRRELIARHLKASRAFLRAQVADVLDLAGHDLLPIADALCTFETYELLRRDQELSSADTVRTLILALTTLLGG